MALVGLTFRLDRRAADNLFPRGALSISAPIGLALWILALHGMTQTSVTLFLPLLLQVVHQVSPVVINFLSIVISMGWTIGTFTVSGWSGKRERIALASRAGHRHDRARLPDGGGVAAGARADDLERLCDGDRHRRLQRAPRRPRDGQRRPPTNIAAPPPP